MKLWLLRPADGLNEEIDPWDPWFDKCFGFVVRAETEQLAREFAHENAADENRGWEGKTSCPWLDSAFSTCVELTADGDAGVVLTDFAAA